MTGTSWRTPAEPSASVAPGEFLRACRIATGCDEYQAGPGGLAASPAEALRRALSALTGYSCDCILCERVGGTSTYCAARVVHGLIPDDLSQRLMREALA